MDHHGLFVYTVHYITSINYYKKIYYYDTKITERGVVGTKTSTTLHVVLYDLIAWKVLD